MRELKFRVWDNHDHRMIYIGRDLQSYIGWEIMQYTGLKDKNGNEIYEGDILKVKMGSDWQTLPMIVQNIWDAHVWTNESDSYMRVNDMEIIGNVYENPELLKGN
jgi:uncharacterized phage protein (TIGR01671 family)